ncbi:MAG: LytTR family transcriptional regulator DNA-binding domain-containing protein [Ruminococcus sp.]|nr:LytTR family transcriptional regulator DNA-binding domain-containing protein [Ruminococcus sp.]
MKLKTILDKKCEEKILIYAHEETPLIRTIEKLVEEETAELIGYVDREGVVLELMKVSCFIVDNNKVYALIDNKRLVVKYRMYQLLEKLPDNFVKINQSCIANIKNIKSFDTSISGALLVKMKNGYSDYVSRRQLKSVKERLGL